MVDEAGDNMMNIIWETVAVSRFSLAKWKSHSSNFLT